MSLPRARPALATALAVAALCAAVSACGTSIRGMYESDVRFEHCMALDAASDPKPAAQRACWDEWTSFYTFGQTRDRIDYARSRMIEIGAANAAGASAPKKEVAAAVPDPTSAYAPPPSTLTTPDAGALTPSASASAATPDATCGTRCDLGREACRGLCKGAACESACATREARCRATCARAHTLK